MGRQDVQSLRHRHDRGRWRHAAEEDVGQRDGQGVGVAPEGQIGVALVVRIYKQGAPSTARGDGGEGDGRDGFPDPALVHRHGDDAPHPHSPAFRVPVLLSLQVAGVRLTRGLQENVGGPGNGWTSSPGMQ